METEKPEIKIKSSIQENDSVLDSPEEKINSVKPIVIKKKKNHMTELLANVPKNSNEFLRKKEYAEYQEEEKSEPRFLYPTLNDPLFSEKIASHKEFFDTQYDGEIRDVKEYAKKMCDASFELLPHQLFVKNFLSFQTPYNSLLLYHGLGTGKTCSSIGIGEEMRSYMRQTGIKQRIIVVAAPNVQANYKLQLFDERRLYQKDGLWHIDSCNGNTFIKEVNPTNLKDVSREKLISQIKTIINQYYVFMGYVELANYIRKKVVVESTGFSTEEKKKMELQNMRRFFNNRLIIIDEVHNIRLADDNKDDKTGKLLMKLAKHCNNMRLLLLSATPMYNSYSEIIWLTNLMNANDKRGLIQTNEVFEQDGSFVKEKKNDKGQLVQESGEDLLRRKLIGYVSYIRGENPYTFPYRIYPNIFALHKTFHEPSGAVGNLVKAGQALIGNDSKQFKLPTTQLNGKNIEHPLQNMPLYITKVGSYQNNAYNLVIRSMKKDIEGNKVDFDEMDRFGFRRLQTPLEVLNIVYPSELLDEQIKKGQLEISEEGISETDENKDPRATMVGKRGMNSVMNYLDESHKKIPRKYNFSYKPEVQKKYGRIFSQSELAKYSAKIHEICETIRKSEGIILIYSQYIDGGVVPIALALEEMGFTRFGTSEYTKPLFETPPVEPLDSVTMKPKSEVSGDFNQAKYVMITGDKSYSPQNAQDIKHVTNPNNKNGEKIKVVLISKAGSEGLDFKCIRQIHILEPWYNTNRIEQIIGRGVRNLSHCLLPFEKRNVEIYMYGTCLENETEEATDVYIYRLAKRKAEQIGRVTRLLKETAVDCLLNIGQSNFTEAKLRSLASNQNIKLVLSNGKQEIDFSIGDSPHSHICDYMEDCDYKCNKKINKVPEKPREEMYNNDYLQTNNGKLMKRIRDIYRDDKKGEHFYELTELIDMINITKQYPIEQIYSALQNFLKNKNEYIIDKWGRRGNLINKGNIYAFQPVEITDDQISVFERKVPIDYKRTKLVMEIPKEFDTNVQEEEQTQNYESILRNIETQLNNATKTQEIPHGEQDWYKHASQILNHVQLVHNISYENFVKYIVQHNVDSLMPEDKMTLLSHFYSKIYNKFSETEEIIKKYLDKNMITYKNKSGYVLVNTKSWTLYIQSSEDPGEWKEAEPEDIRNFKQSGQMNTVLGKNAEQYPRIVGFIDMFRNGKEMVFRIKDLNQLQNNTGTRINGQTPGKGDIIKRLNQIVHDGENVSDPMYSLTKSREIMQQGLCVIVELILRHRTQNEYKNQIWYLNPEQASYNNISKFRRS